MGSQEEEFIVFELVFHGREPQLDTFSNEFDRVQWVSKHIRTLGPPEVAYHGGPPAELVVLVVSLSANILTIADILAKRLARRNDNIIRVGKKEIQLKGVWRPEEIADVLTLISKKTSKKGALEHIAEIKSARIIETRKQLMFLEDAIHAYEKLVKTFNDIPEKKNWQKKRAKEYQKRLSDLQKEADSLMSFIDFLSRED